MAGRVIQGFFIAGRARPLPGRPTSVPVQRRAASGPVRAGPPAPAFSGSAKPLQAHGANGSFAVDPVQLGLARSGGAPLPAPVLDKMEAAFGADFSSVRVHVGPQAARIGAIAFTTGNDIYFAPGRYQPESVQGQQLLGHELAHVIQQRQGRVRMPGSGVAVVQDHALEAEADRLGMRAALHRASPVQAKAAQAKGAHGGSVNISAPMADGANSFRVRAGVGGREVGSLRMHNRGSTMEVTDLGVDPGFRDQGVGKQLLANVAKAGMRMGKATVSLSAEDNGSGRLTRWYRSMGFTQRGVDERGMARLEASAGRLLAGALQRRAAPGAVYTGHLLAAAASRQPVPHARLGGAQPIQNKKGANPLKAAASAARASAAVAPKKTILDEDWGEQIVGSAVGDASVTSAAGTAYSVRYYLDYMQGKHDDAFVGRHPAKARKKKGGSKVPSSHDYAASVTSTVKPLLESKLATLLGKGQGVAYDFAVQATKQTDNLYYEISARWETVGATNYIVVYYHCYP